MKRILFICLSCIIIVLAVGACMRASNPLSPFGLSVIFGKSKYLHFNGTDGVYSVAIADGGGLLKVIDKGSGYIKNVNASFDDLYVYVTARKGTSGYTNLYRYMVDGSGEKLILSGAIDAGVAMEPEIAAKFANGTIVVDEVRVGGLSHAYVVYDVYGDTRSTVLVTNSVIVKVPPVGPINGSVIYFITNAVVGAGPETNFVKIRKYDTASRALSDVCTCHYLVDTTQAWGLLCSPDGKTLLYYYHGDTSNTFTLHTVDTATGAKTYIGSISTNSEMSVGSWSPYPLPTYLKLVGSMYESGTISTTTAAITKKKDVIRTAEWATTAWIDDPLGKSYLITNSITKTGVPIPVYE